MLSRQEKNRAQLDKLATIQSLSVCPALLSSSSSAAAAAPSPIVSP